MIKRILSLVVLGGLIALPACTSNQAAVQPGRTIAPVANSELQFQVGTANYSGTTFLNTVVTFRQPNGLSALLDNTPNMTIPFTNTAPAYALSSGCGGVIAYPCAVVYAGNDSGQARISGTVQTNNGVNSSDPRTFPQSVGAFAYGLLAVNSSTTGADSANFYPSATNAGTNPDFSKSPGNQAWRMPIYGAVHAPAFTQRAFYVGPPAVPNFNDGSLGVAFNGYPSGFTTFALTPTTGTYALSVGLPNSSTPVPTFTATTTLASLALLPNMPTPVYTSDHVGGGTVTVTVPPGIAETAIFIRDLAPSGATIFYYTLVTHGTGPQTLVLPPNIGRVNNGPATVPGGTGFMTADIGDTISIVAIGFDYPAMEAVPTAANPPQAPPINNTSTPCTFAGQASTCTGQADVTLSGAGTFTE